MVQHFDRLSASKTECKQGSAEVQKNIGVIGSRSLPCTAEELVLQVTENLLHRGFRLSSGGAVGADQYCLSAIVHLGECEKSTIYTPWNGYEGFPVKIRALTRQFKEYGGAIVWGTLRGKEEYPVVRTGLLQRNVRLIEAVDGIVAFLHGESNGSLFTIRKALAEHMPVVIFCFERELPEFKNIKWTALKCGGCWEGAYKAVYLK